MELPPASGPALRVWEMGDEILVGLMDGRIQRTADKMSYWNYGPSIKKNHPLFAIWLPT